MKKLIALFLAGIVLLSSCTAETPAMSEFESEPEIEIEMTEPLIEISEEPETPEEPEPEIIEPEPEPPVRQTVDEHYLQRANEIAEAFINKDTERLSFYFADDSVRAFDFVRELDFVEFELIHHEVEEINERFLEWVYYFNITVENGTDDIFTLGGKEWELRLRSEERSVVLQFSPKGTVINRLWNSTWSDYAKICYEFSNDLEAFETMSDFNLLIYNFGDDKIYDEFGFINWDSYTYRATILINRIQRLLENEERPWHHLTADEIIAQAEYMFGITNLDYSALEIFIEKGFGHGWFWRYPVLVSETFTATGAEIILNFYGDTGHLFVAKTMKYNLEFGEQGVRIVSTELLYSNDDLVIARGVI
jgi:Fe-S cluster biosynthesis and repair protein YggX